MNRYPHTAYIALGSNEGDRLGNLAGALAVLRERPDVLVRQASRVYETSPVGGPAGQGWYLNAAAELATCMGPIALLALLQQIEALLRAQLVEST